MNSSRRNTPTIINAKRMLIGEGWEEVLFFQALLEELKISGVHVECYDGKSKLDVFLRAVKNRSGFSLVERLAITRDADEDAVAARTSVQAAIKQADFPQTLTISTFMLHGELNIGALEDLCLLSMKGEKIEDCINNYLASARNALNTVHSSTSQKAKARIHTWLAAQNEPDLRLGHAAIKGLLNWNSPAFSDLIKFLQMLA
ncbi:MAG: hypothetical protein JWQ71_832 [Pedosphaera sp.]|nr:hypothetical protein [Pedosphaera sp.]